MICHNYSSSVPLQRAPGLDGLDFHGQLKFAGCDFITAKKGGKEKIIAISHTKEGDRRSQRKRKEKKEVEELKKMEGKKEGEERSKRKRRRSVLRQ